MSGESEAEHVPPDIGLRRVPFVGCSPDELRVHRLSGVVHRLKGVEFFWCGRPAAGRYRDFSVDDQDEPVRKSDQAGQIAKEVCMLHSMLEWISSPGAETTGIDCIHV